MLQAQSQPLSRDTEHLQNGNRYSPSPSGAVLQACAPTHLPATQCILVQQPGGKTASRINGQILYHQPKQELVCAVIPPDRDEILERREGPSWLDESSADHTPASKQYFRISFGFWRCCSKFVHIWNPACCVWHCWCVLIEVEDHREGYGLYSSSVTDAGTDSYARRW